MEFPYMKYRILLFLFFVSALTSIAQVKDYSLGATMMGRSYQQSGFFDLSDPDAVNIKVSVWGWVKYPGRYTVPNYTDVSDLISYAGGPLEGAELDDIRLVRINEDSTQTMLKFSYNDLMYESKLETKYRKVPRLDAADVLIVPGEPRLYFRDHFSMWMSLISVLISLTILVLNIVKN
jgi:hypothetical protein